MPLSGVNADTARGDLYRYTSSDPLTNSTAAWLALSVEPLVNLFATDWFRAATAESSRWVQPQAVSQRLSELKWDDSQSLAPILSGILAVWCAGLKDTRYWGSAARYARTSEEDGEGQDFLGRAIALDGEPAAKQLLHLTETGVVVADDLLKTAKGEDGSGSGWHFVLAGLARELAATCVAVSIMSVRHGSLALLDRYSDKGDDLRKIRETFELASAVLEDDLPEIRNSRDLSSDGVLNAVDRNLTGLVWERFGLPRFRAWSTLRRVQLRDVTLAAEQRTYWRFQGLLEAADDVLHHADLTSLLGELRPGLRPQGFFRGKALLP